MLDMEDPCCDVANEIFNCLNDTETLLYERLPVHIPFKYFSTKSTARRLVCADVQLVVQRTVLSVPELGLYECFKVDQFA